jgi:SAM-dependent methyltransferase
MGPAEQQFSTSRAVLDEIRDFYERMPYPEPVASLDQNRHLYANPERHRALFHLIWPTERPRGNQDILIAGCGTSQAARYALREPNARITAIDISETSLRHTGDLQHRYSLENLELHRLPIESVHELGRSFDLIVCTGVLHHLPDPDVGLRALHDVLRPQGAMHLMVYARYGRTGIYMMQEYCRLLGIGTSESDLRNLGDTLDALPADHPIAALLGRAKDFRRPEAMADALLHPRDRAYTVPELYTWFKRCGMSFGRWYEQAPYLPQCGDIAKTPYAARLHALPQPEQHAAAELFRGTLTQHNFVAYRSDCPKPMQPIQFTGEQWRHYVPIRLPWTVSVRHRVPPGSVAVLLNPAHKHPDLDLPINVAQEHLLEQIDGVRTLGEIVRSRRKEDNVLRGLRFFRRPVTGLKFGNLLTLFDKHRHYAILIIQERLNFFH